MFEAVQTLKAEYADIPGVWTAAAIDVAAVKRAVEMVRNGKVTEAGEEVSGAQVFGKEGPQHLLVSAADALIDAQKK